MRAIHIWLIASLVVFLGCSKEKEESTDNNNVMLNEQAAPSHVQNTDEDAPLFVKLDELRHEEGENWDQNDIELFDNGIHHIVQSGMMDNMPMSESKAIPFQLPDENGNTVRLTELLKSGPIVLMWIQGGWNEYCNLTLQTMQKNLAKIEELGGTLVAVTPQTQTQALKQKEKNNIQFMMLCDRGNAVARKYNLVYTIPEKFVKVLTYGISFEEYYGTKRTEMPITATFVIDSAGKIQYVFADPDFRMRANPDEIIDILLHLWEQKQTS